MIFLTNKGTNNPLIFISFHLIGFLASTLEFFRHFLLSIIGWEKFRLENIIPLIELAFVYYLKG